MYRKKCLTTKTANLISYFQAKYLTKNTAASSVESVKALDDFLVQLTVSFNIQLICIVQRTKNVLRSNVDM